MSLTLCLWGWRRAFSESVELKRHFPVYAAEAISLYCGKVRKTLFLDLNLCIHGHLQTWGKHFLCPCENCKRRFVQSNNLKAYVSETQHDFFLSSCFTQRTNLNNYPYVDLYSILFWWVHQNPSYSNLANITQNQPELHASPSSWFTSWNLWILCRQQGFILSLPHVKRMWISLVSASIHAIHHRYENSHGDLKEISASKFNDHIRDSLNSNSNKASFMSKWYY
jgi:hypothetical protein